MPLAFVGNLDEGVACHVLHACILSAWALYLGPLGSPS